MRKIPTLFVRDPDDRKHVLPDVTPGCEWVLAGEGTPTRKYDGTCVRFDGSRWWARREVKPGKQAPAGYVAEEHDETTGKTVGWEPAEQSSFAAVLAEAVVAERWLPHLDGDTPYVLVPGTYELLAPKVNGNPEGVEQPILVRHGYSAAATRDEIDASPRDFEGLREWLLAHDFEGIVWHHPDGRMAKLKKRDFDRGSMSTSGEGR